MISRYLGLGGGLMIASCSSGPRADLSPAHWPAAERERLFTLGASSNRPREEATGRTGMVVGTSGPLAIHAGVEALRQGGSAADAALTTSLTQIALAAGSWVSYAGIIALIYYDAASGQAHAMDGVFNSLEQESDPLTIPPMGTPSGRTVLVGGFMAGVEEAHRRFGRLPFAAIFEPAIFVAEQGVSVNRSLAAMIAQRSDVLGRLPETRSIFFKPNGDPYAEGDHFKQPALAATLRSVASEGAAYMYTGHWAKQFVDAVKRAGGRMTLEDLARYRIAWSRPATTRYRDFDVHAMPLPDLGGSGTLAALNLLDAADFSSKGHYSTSPDAFYWFTQVIRALVLLQPANAGGAPGPGGASDLVALHMNGLRLGDNTLLKSDSAAVVWSAMQGEGWRRLLAAHQERNRGASSEVIDALLRSTERPPSRTDGVVAVDRWGNLAAIMHSINTVSWGTTGIFVDGVSIPDAGAFLQDGIKAAGPGNRILNDMHPVVVLREGKPILGSVAIGGAGTLPVSLQSITSVLDFGMSPQQAVDTAQFLGFEFVPSRSHIITVREGDFSEQLLRQVGARGQPVRAVPPAEQRLLGGYWVGIAIDPVSRVLRGGVPRRLNGMVEGY